MKNLNSLEILTGIIGQNNQIGFSQLKPAMVENLYLLMGFIGFILFLSLSLYLERKLESRRKERARKNRDLPENLLTGFEFINNSERTNMRIIKNSNKDSILKTDSLEHVI